MSLDETIRQRTLLYLLMVVLSAALFVGAVYLGRRLAARAGRLERDVGCGGRATSSRSRVVMLILPTIDETPGPLRDDAGTIVFEGFPADDLYEFRLYSLGTQVVDVGDDRSGVRGADLEGAGRQANRRGRSLGVSDVSEIVRLTLVSHAMTDAMAAGRFPSDEPLNALGQRQVDATIDLGVVDAAVCGPEKRTRQTAELLGLRAETEPLLADLDCGALARQRARRRGPAELALWLTDPTQAPHGGESVVDLVDRVRRLAGLAGGPPRAAGRRDPSAVSSAPRSWLRSNAPPKSFWRIDVGPVSRTVLHLRGRAWTLRSTG